MFLPDNHIHTIERLQSTLGKMEVALASIIDSIVWTDAKGVIQWCNAPFDRLVSRNHLQVLGQSLMEALPLKDHPLETIMAGNEKYHSEYEFNHAGEKKILDVYASRIRMSEQSAETIVFVVRDITDKKISEINSKRLLEEMSRAAAEKEKTAELERAYLASLNIMSDLDKERNKLQKEIDERQKIEARLQQLLVSVEQSPNTIMITDTNGMIQYVNAQFQAMTGYAPFEVLQTQAIVLMKGHLKDDDHKELWESLRLGKVWKGELLNKKKNGETYWEYIVVSPVHDKSNKITNYLLIMQDITDRKNGEEQMKAALEIKAEFTSTVSHELRTPLASIKGSIDIIMDKLAGPLTPDQEKFLGKAKSNIDRLKRLIDDFLDLSKLESGRVELDIQPRDIGLIIKDVLAIQETVAKSKGLKLEAVNMLDNFPLIPCDEDKINQVLLNLINNAIKFTEQGAVTLSVEMKEGLIQFCVADTGEGIKEEDIPKLFEKFYQFGDPAKRKTGGTGLGLTICKEIITQHGGKIWAESSIGQGSRFYFQLPIAERGNKNGSQQTGL